MEIDSPATNYRILLIDDDRDRQQLIDKLLQPAPHRYTVEATTDYDDAISRIDRNIHSAYLVSKDFSNQRGLEIVRKILERRCKGPALLLSPRDNHKVEKEAFRLGAMVFLTDDQLQPQCLERTIRHAIYHKRHDANIRREHEELIRRIIDVEDTRDRFEAQSAEYVGMAEELVAAQTELQTALDIVTESERQLDQLNREKDRFFSIIAHDLRSPFTSLLGYTGLIASRADKLSPEQVIEFAGNIDQSAKRVFNLLENLLEWAHLQRDQVAIVPTMLNVSAVVKKTVDVLGPVGKDKGVRVITDIDEQEQYFGDANIIETVVRNLLNNAIKFTPDKGTVTIAARPNGSFYEITVTDTGIGLSPEKINKLFSLGEHNSTSGTEGEKGTGLGLLLCRDLLQKISGTITVTSEPGKGSTFTVLLPAH